MERILHPEASHRSNQSYSHKFWYSPAIIESFDTIPNPPMGNLLKKRWMYLNKVKKDIFFCDCVALVRHWYYQLLVDVATRYCCIFRISSLYSTSITPVLDLFISGAQHLHRIFRSDFDRKLISRKVLRCIHANNSNIITTPYGFQSYIGLDKRTWRTIFQTTREVITKYRFGREFWYFLVHHAAMIIIQVPGLLGLKIDTSLELYQNT